MEARNWIGIIILIIGVILQPVGWMYFAWVTALSFVFIFVGIFIFVTQKYIEHKENIEFGGRSDSDLLHKNTSLPLMGDIHNESGQRTGGRNDNWSSDSFSGGDVGSGD